MALAIKTGLVDGNRDELSLVATVFDAGGASLNVNDDAVLLFAKANVPAQRLGCKLTDRVEILERSATAISFRFHYRHPVVETVRRSANFVCPAKRIFNFIAPVGVYDVSGEISSTNLSLGMVVAPPGSADEFHVDRAITIEPLPETRSLDVLTSSKVMTRSYFDAIEGLVGKFNQSPFQGYQPFSFQLVRFTAVERDYEEVQMSFGFGVFTQKTNVDIGDGVVIPKLRGLDYYWVQRREELIDGSIQPKVHKVVVGQVWETGDFNELQLPVIK